MGKSACASFPGRLTTLDLKVYYPGKPLQSKICPHRPPAAPFIFMLVLVLAFVLIWNSNSCLPVSSLILSILSKKLGICGKKLVFVPAKNVF